MTGVPKAVVCGILNIKEPLLERVAHVAAAGFPICYLIGSLPYVQHHITINKKYVECVIT